MQRDKIEQLQADIETGVTELVSGDPEVLADYQAVLGADASIAGPSASAVRNGELPPAAVEWLKTNFFRTELELGHCLRLPPKAPANAICS